MSTAKIFIEKFAARHPLPHIVTTVTRLINDPDSTRKDFEEVTKMDPVLVSRFLRLKRYFALYLPEWQATLGAYVLSEDSWPEDISCLTKLAVRGCFDRKEVERLNKKSTIRKNQFNSKFQVLDAKHQQMLEETQHRYRTLQEHQERMILMPS